MYYVEALIRQSKPRNEQITESGVSYVWYDSDISQIVLEQDPLLCPREPDMLRAESVPGLLFEGKLYDQQLLTETTTRLVGEGELKKLHTSLLQAGNKAVILLNRADVVTEAGEQSCYFVSYVSRGSVNSELAIEAEEDYKNLSELAEGINNLPEEIRRGFKVVQPLAFSTESGRPIFTMPFVENQGELHMDVFVVEDGEQDFPFPFYTYAIPQNEQMDKEMKEQLTTVINAKKEIEAITRGEQVEAVPNWNKLKQQQYGILRALALTYCISGGRLPKDFSINSGDFMAHFGEKDDQLDLTLITVRGGWTEQLDFKQAVSMLKAHQENLHPNNPLKRFLRQFAPFDMFKREAITQILVDVWGELEDMK